VEPWPKISVVLPIRNEADFIAQTIKYLQNQDYPHDKLEILVVVGDSRDKTVEIVQWIASQDDRVKYLPNPKLLSSAARNIGAKAATGEIITYVDGHTYIDNDQLLKSTARLMAEKDVAVLSRPQFLETPENTTFQKAISLARMSRLGHGLDSTIYSNREMYVNPASAGASYKREVFDKVGYFDERFDAAEDYEFNHRVAEAGYRAFTSPKLTVYYYPRQSLGALFKQMGRYGTGRMRLARKHLKTVGIGTLLPPLFTLGLSILPLIWMFSHWGGMLWSLCYGLYALLVIISSAAIAVQNGMVYLFLAPPIYLFIHLGLGYGFLKELIRGPTLKQSENRP
jgi:cellulose synthase/poly-beta-1,6-N-acetylglucosamine synthase-like glycosyltransferase